MEYGINRNGSGYYDPTAFQGIKNYIKSEENIMEFYKGDIVEIETNNGSTREAVILSAHERFATILILTDNESLPCSVNCKGMKYTDPGMIQYVFNEKINNLIRSMNDDEIDYLMEKVVEALGYKEPVKEVVKEITHEPTDFEDKVQSFIETAESLKADLTKAKAERDVYKQLYDNLIKSMIAK